METKRKALKWWNEVLTEYGRSQFPKPKNDEDITNYYNSPVEFTFAEYDQLNNF